MKIVEVTRLTEEVTHALQQLIHQLAPDSPLPSGDDLEGIIQSESTILFIAKDKAIAGTLTLVFQKTATGPKAWIEDVVVDDTFRGKGIGEKLVQHAVDYARQKGITKIDLTSSPDRTAANNLYQKLGFKKRETNVYRYESQPGDF